MSIPVFTMNGHLDSEPLFTTTSLSNREKPELAAPGQDGRALPGATITGDVTASPIPIPTIDDAMLLGEESARALFGGVVLQRWHNQADGFFG